MEGNIVGFNKGFVVEVFKGIKFEIKGLGDGLLKLVVLFEFLIGLMI